MRARCRRIAVLACTGVLLLGGCGSASTPAEEVPELADTLTAIDEALAEQRYPSARRHLRHLVDTVEAARSSGDLEDAQADRVLAAAAHLLAALPAPPLISEQPREPEPGPDPQDDEGDEESEDRDDDRDEEEKRREEERKKDEGGNGDSSENRPDYGHGD